MSRIQGTGLGMAIARNIIDMMGGEIEVHTEQGKGTEFVIRLTLRLQEGKYAAEKIAALEEMTALVVDDDYNTCGSVTKMLRKVGMRSEWTLSGKKACSGPGTPSRWRSRSALILSTGGCRI